MQLRDLGHALAELRPEIGGKGSLGRVRRSLGSAQKDVSQVHPPKRAEQFRVLSMRSMLQNGDDKAAHFGKGLREQTRRNTAEQSDLSTLEKGQYTRGHQGHSAQSTETERAERLRLEDKERVESKMGRAW